MATLTESPVSSLLSLAGSDELVALAERIRPSVVLVRSRAGGGSGVIWREDGLIVTNSHVVPREQAEVLLADGRSFAATVVNRDNANDLASLKVEATGLPAAAIGDSTSLRTGQLILAMGNPMGRVGAATVGVVNAKELGFRSRGWRSPAAWQGRRSDNVEFVRAYIQLAPGNSGGPLVDTEGRVVGINSRIAAPRLALAVPSHIVERFLATGPADPLRLGIGGGDVELPLSLRERLGLQHTTGVMIVHLIEGELAERTDLLLGDIILTVNDHPIPSLAALVERLGEHKQQEDLQLRILRGGQVVDLVVPVSDTPKEEAA